MSRLSRATRPSPADLIGILDVALAHAADVDAVTAARLSACCKEFHVHRDALFSSATEVAVFGDELLHVMVRRFPNARTVELSSCDDVDDELAVAAPFMSNVKHLVINDCVSLTDRGLQAIRPLANLETLGVVSTDLGGETNGGVTGTGISALACMTNLRTLYLRNCAVTDAALEDLKGLTNLEDLDLDLALVTDRGMTTLAEMTRLKNLGLYGTDVTDDGVALLAALPKLQTLDVSYTGLSGEGLAGLTNLTDLQMRWCDAAGHVSSLRSLTNLERLELVCVDLSDEDLRQLAPLTNLQTLLLYDCSTITKRGVAGLARLPKLRQIVI